MKKLTLTFLLGLIFFFASAQPYENALWITFSDDGINFSVPEMFQDSSGVPSITMLNDGTLICAFQWFPAPMFGEHWDSVAVKFSTDTGLTWSNPIPVNFEGMPPDFVRPFDPAIANTGNDSIRMYFSCGTSQFLDSTVNSYSAISADGINYTYESGPRFEVDSLPVIDPSVLKFKGTWHYVAPRGAPQDGAYHATSIDGLNFAPQNFLPSDNFHQWTGNLMIDGDSLRFYGSSPGGNIWLRSSIDGFAWNPPRSTNIFGGDNSVVKLPNGKYMMIFVADSPSSLLPQTTKTDVKVFVQNSKIIIQSKNFSKNTKVTIYNTLGQLFATSKITNNRTEIPAENLPPGIYNIVLSDNSGIIHFTKIIMH